MSLLSTLQEVRFFKVFFKVFKFILNSFIYLHFLGEIVNTPDLVEGLKSGKIFGVALDVFEGEKAFMFKDMTKVGYEHYPELQELTSMHNVIISSHIAFYTDESVKQITEKTLSNFEGFIGKSEVDEKAFVA